MLRCSYLLANKYHHLAYNYSCVFWLNLPHNGDDTPQNYETGPIRNAFVEFDHNFISFNVVNFSVYFMVSQEIWDPCIRYRTQVRTEESSNIKCENWGINISPCGRPPQRSEALRSYGKFCNKNNNRARNFNKRILNVRVRRSELFGQRERCWRSVKKTT